MSHDDNYTAVILEEIRNQNKAVLEAVGQMQDKMNTLATQESLDTLSGKVETIQKALIDTNHDLSDHEQRITALEQAA